MLIQKSLILALVAATAATLSADTIEHPTTDAYPGWNLAVQAWSFRKFNLFQAIDRTAACGIDFIELFPGQELGPDFPNVTFGPGMPPDAIAAVKTKLQQSGVTALNIGVIPLDNNESNCRQVFNFAKTMGITTIVSEPEQDALELIDQLAQEYQINVALHNHPTPSRYWDPDTVLQALQGRSNRLGACADTGHWARSGVNPVDALKKLQGRIISFHMKDLNEFGKRKAHDVPWGAGVCNMKAIFQEMARQNFQGPISVEYEYHWENSIDDIRQCAQFLQTTAQNDLNAKGFQPLFDWDLSNADMEPNAWTWENNVLTCHNQGDIWTKDTYSDFILDCDFMVAPNTNSGIFLRAAEKTWLPWAEVQIRDDHGKEPTRESCGGIFDIAAPKTITVKPAGQWNHLTITAKGPTIQVILNNQEVTNINLDNWTTPGQNPDNTPNKFKDIAYKNLPRQGHLALQDHGQPISFRDLTIKPLD